MCQQTAKQGRRYWWLESQDQQTYNSCKWFSKRENKKERVALYSNVWFTDSSRAKPVRTQTISQKRSTKRKASRNQYKNKLRTTNEKFIKNMSNTNLTDQEIALLAKGLKFIPTPKNWLLKKSSWEISIPLLALCVWNIYLLTLQAIHIRSMSDLTGNHHQNHQWL